MCVLLHIYFICHLSFFDNNDDLEKSILWAKLTFIVDRKSVFLSHTNRKAALAVVLSNSKKED